MIIRLRNIRSLATTTLAALLLLPASSYAQELTEFSAYYEASTNGISGNAERHLVHQGDERYRLNISLEAKVGGIQIGDLEQSSEFHWTGEQIQPQQYHYQVSGVSSDVESVSFNWDAKVAISAEEDQSWTLELQDGVLDQMTYQLALALDLLDEQEEQEATGLLHYSLVDGPVIEEHQFRVLGEEIITTPLGRLRCLKLERVRATENGRSTEIWLAQDWDNLLVRIEQGNPSGLQIQLALTMALVDGETVTPLP
jgi:hypothetical protein